MLWLYCGVRMIPTLAVRTQAYLYWLLERMSYLVNEVVRVLIVCVNVKSC